MDFSLLLRNPSTSIRFFCWSLSNVMRKYGEHVAFKLKPSKSQDVGSIFGSIKLSNLPANRSECRIEIGSNSCISHIPYYTVSVGVSDRMWVTPRVPGHDFCFSFLILFICLIPCMDDAKQRWEAEKKLFALELIRLRGYQSNMCVRHEVLMCG